MADDPASVTLNFDISYPSRNGSIPTGFLVYDPANCIIDPQTGVTSALVSANSDYKSGDRALNRRSGGTITATKAQFHAVGYGFTDVDSLAKTGFLIAPLYMGTSWQEVDTMQAYAIPINWIEGVEGWFTLTDNWLGEWPNMVAGAYYRITILENSTPQYTYVATCESLGDWEKLYIGNLIYAGQNEYYTLPILDNGYPMVCTLDNGSSQWSIFGDIVKVFGRSFAEDEYAEIDVKIEQLVGPLSAATKWMIYSYGFSEVYELNEYANDAYFGTSMTMDEDVLYRAVIGTAEVTSKPSSYYDEEEMTRPILYIGNLYYLSGLAADDTGEPFVMTESGFSVDPVMFPVDTTIEYALFRME